MRGERVIPAAGGRETRQSTIALVGNPNVGKSTVFNALTGMRQHTGNWPGKTVGSAQGEYRHRGRAYRLVDLPGVYSLLPHSAEEEVARDFLCFEEPDGAVLVCDATCLERNLNLVLQTLELIPNAVVCVNLLDEARAKGIAVHLAGLSRRLGVPVVGTAANRREGLTELKNAVAELRRGNPPPDTPPVRYPAAIEQAARCLFPAVERGTGGAVPTRWAALRLLEGDETLFAALAARLGWNPAADSALQEALCEAHAVLRAGGIAPETCKETIVTCITYTAERISGEMVCGADEDCHRRDRRLDRILTGRLTGIPLMLGLLAGILWLTIAGANYPSQLLAEGLFWVQDRLTALFTALGAPDWLHGALVLGVYRVLAWVVSVMLPPMAIFFPLFTLLEDFGYLPRIAFVLDHAFQKARTCGKQALTMCMGFGCNAAGVVGCRIIDSPRERLIAIMTNSLVPCNGRFPILIAIITMFFVGTQGGVLRSFLSALLLLGTIVLGVLLTFAVSRLLSVTVLKGIPSSFALELPPYRRPRIGQVIVRSMLDRTLFVLRRAVIVAAPAGLLIWLLANVQVDGVTLLAYCTDFLDPFARLLGLDGVILIAFILGFPASEIVIPVMIMTYLASGTLTDFTDYSSLHELLIAHGWTWRTALCTMLFTLVHWPCSTTCLTIGKEAGRAKWTLLAVAIPTAIGMALCALVAAVTSLLP
ncbi:MAG: ferrous iron transport protein B [Oscillospiraceae bacterium]|nr:ferrous iron transport protein B [Oscillospiraceae bacterium]